MVLKTELFVATLVILVLLQCLPAYGKGCSNNRLSADKCTGKRIGSKSTFESCKAVDGKCCATNLDGSRALGINRGDAAASCGYCFTGKCKA